MLRAFPGIPVKEAQELIASGQVQAYEAGVVLCHEDAYESTFYIILEGRVRVTKMINASQNEVRLLKSLETGDFFGEMALLQNAPRAATVTTAEPTSVLEIRKEYFNDLLRSSASLARAMVQEVVRRLRQNDAMAIEDLRIKAGELASAYQQLAEQQYARSEFLTTIAHELRTPLTAAQGFLQMIEMSQATGMQMSPEMQAQAIKTASRNLQQIISLVNDILFVQEMDLILPTFELVDLGMVLRQAADASQPKMLENGTNLYLNLSSDLPKVLGDAKSLQRAFEAVLDNAIKYSHDGGQVDVSATSADGQVQVTVQDYGVGIPADKLACVFDRFFHIDQMNGKVYRGVGLGLSIAKQVIEQHHGKIKVASQEGEGTTVSVTLNAASPA
jgi:signal transduction histidine kinase